MLLTYDGHPRRAMFYLKTLDEDGKVHKANREENITVEQQLETKKRGI